MKPLVILILLAFTLIVIPVQGDQYLTESQKELLLKESRALGSAAKQGHAQNTSKQSEQSEQTNIVKQQSRPEKSRRTTSRYLGVITKNPASHTSSVVNGVRTQTQGLQSVVHNTGGVSPDNSNLSVQQDQRLANTAKRRNSDRQSQQVATITTKTTTNYTNNSNRSVQQSRKVAKTKKKFNWSSFFKGLGQVAEAINSGMNQTNPQFNPYISQPGNFSPRGNSQIINTMKVGNHTLNVGGDQEIHTWDIGNQTFGISGGKKVKMHNFDNFSTGTIGDQKVRCHMAGNIKFCK